MTNPIPRSNPNNHSPKTYDPTPHSNEKKKKNPLELDSPSPLLGCSASRGHGRFIQCRGRVDPRRSDTHTETLTLRATNTHTEYKQSSTRALRRLDVARVSTRRSADRSARSQSVSSLQARFIPRCWFFFLFLYTHTGDIGNERDIVIVKLCNLETYKRRER